MIGVFIFGAVVLVGIVVFFSIQMAKQADESWARAAQTFGLRFEPGGLFRARKMTGSVQGSHVVVDTWTQSQGKSSTTYTRFRVGFPKPVVAGLKLTRQGFFTGVASLFGSQDIEVGNAEFDDAVVVKGANARDVVKFLTPARRVRILRLLSNHSGLVVESSGIEWSRRGVIRKSGELTSTLRSFLGTAAAIAGSADEDAPLERALTARAAGDLAGARAHLDQARARRIATSRPSEPAAPPMPPIPRMPPNPRMPEQAAVEPIDETLMEGELLYLEGRREEAQRVFEEARKTLPEDPEVRAWAKQVDGAEPEPEAAGDGSSLDVEAVCKALFVDVSSSLDTNRIFDAHYKEQEVAWEGMLRQVESFSFDFVLGNKGGTKALVDVYEVAGAVIGGRAVTAVVGLPKDAEEGLRPLVGKRVRVEGRLVRADGFMRNLFVKDGVCKAV